MTAFDAVDDSHHRHRDFRLWHITDISLMDGDFRFRALSGHPMSAFLRSSVRDAAAVTRWEILRERKCAAPDVIRCH